ncbi:MAG: MBL fold metallo-hydrolase [Phycisphaeraceae bacterium]|nr:MBL fold metallo-hydrolase [Phycisphaeraceae bacterium]
MSLCVLGSGSGGNCSVVRFDADEHRGLGRPSEEAGAGQAQAILIDAGFGPFTTRRRLEQAGLTLDSLAAICLTHLDRDHWRGNWKQTTLAKRIPIYVHRWHQKSFSRLPEGADLIEAGLVRPFGDTFSPIDSLEVTAVHLPHDQKGTIGFRLDYHTGPSRVSLGYATDLGAAPPELIDRFSGDGGLDLLAIESNYDPELQSRSDRPAFLKRRIMGELGHLSNEQSFQVVRGIMDASPTGCPRWVVLLHRSRQCNHPDRVREVFGRDDRLAGRVILTDQRRRSAWIRLEPRAAVITAQQCLFDGPKRIENREAESA